jgi:hypothetical protein
MASRSEMPSAPGFDFRAPTLEVAPLAASDAVVTVIPIL